MLRSGTYLPITKERWKELNKWRAILRKSGSDYPDIPEHDVLEANANWLLERCYEPSEDGAQVNLFRLADLDLSKDSINWGDLQASAEQIKGRWYVTIEEASPNASHLKLYITEWLQKWGWRNVHVETEW